MQQNFPHLRILARATSRQHAYELLRKGVQDVYRETFGSAVDLSVGALGVLGLDPQRAQRAAQLFRQHDEESVREMAFLQDAEDEVYVSIARKHVENLENALASDREIMTEQETTR